jgi:hypothetical protein
MVSRRERRRAESRRRVADARSLGPAWTDFWLYIVGPVVGAALAAELD